MGCRSSPVTLLLALWLGQLGAWPAGRPKVNPRIVAAPQGESRLLPPLPEQSRGIFISFVSSGGLRLLDFNWIFRPFFPSFFLFFNVLGTLKAVGKLFFFFPLSAGCIKGCQKAEAGHIS